MLIERDSELETADRLLSRAAGGQGAVLLVEGPPGIGKTALLAEIRSRAAKGGFRLLAALGGELEQDVPFGMVRQLLEPPLRAAGPEVRADLLSGAASLATVVFGMDPGGEGGAGPGGVEHGLYWLCCNLADRPLLLSIDDAQWSDEASMRFISHLGRRLGDIPALLILASRSRRGGDDPIGRALTGLNPTLVELSPISDEAISRLVHAELGPDADDEFCRACARASGGNPFLLIEALTSLRDSGVRPQAAQARRVENLQPDTISRAVLTRLARLGPTAVRVARAVAVLGPAATPRRVAKLARLPVHEVAQLAEALAREAILEPGRPMRFIHPLVRTAVYRDSTEMLRAADHKRAALVLRDDGADPDELAAHLLLAEPEADQWVSQALRAAANGAMARNAPEPAVAFLNRALAEPVAPPQRLAVHAELGQALGMANRPEEAAVVLRQAIDLAPTSQGRVELAMQLGWLMLHTGRSRAAVEAMELARLSINGDHLELPLQLQAALAMVDIITIKPPKTWTARLDPLVPSLSGERDVERLILSVVAFGAAVSGDRPAAEAARLARRSAAGPLLFRDRWILINMASAALAVADHLPESLELLDRGIDDAGRLGNAAEFRYLAVLRSHTAFYAGNLIDAEGDGRAALELQEDTRPQDLPLAAAVLVDALVARGAIEEAQRVVTDNHLDDDQSMTTLIAHFVLLARGRLRLAQGRYAEAAADLRECGRMLTEGGYGNPNFAHWRTAAALAHQALGQTTLAAELAAEDLELSRRFGATSAVARALRVGALIEPGRHALTELEEAASLLDGSPAVLERAHALVDHGAALRRAGYRTGAVAPLRQGLDLADRCAATPLAARAREELTAAGARPRRARLTGREALTTGELRVARLARRGATNREIAQGLFVSMRTVEIHLTSTYRKLAISNRQQLGDALPEEPEGDSG
ncbi:helix-turn-helix transcriptional regulator [Plantactinospora soyae]|uniref:ATP/maltotriose-dependent transcriptional regulator MalT n=1 Tax=Plantactinospora soyae TaxID=1544732 RepID=A0A927M4M0_9ACTN|nr:LuxR family transcriptional regulator [Plantactinospora soyae]MBE1484375.1 ATP/maltotriose-dependent transcriptional regulator MalT [Plantactinospora soyae]